MRDHAAYQRDYRAKHSDEIRAYDRARYLRRRQYLLSKHRERLSTTGRMPYEIAASQRYYERNREGLKEGRRARYLTADGQAQAIRYRAQRRSRLQSDGSVTGQFLTELLAKQRNRCALCRADISTERHADHIIPLSKGGLHTAYNIQLTCPLCNLRKGSKLSKDMPRLTG